MQEEQEEQRKKFEQEYDDKKEYWELVKYAKEELFREYYIANHFCKGIILEYSDICKKGPEAILAKAREKHLI
jgi:hypothetical protein